MNKLLTVSPSPHIKHPDRVSDIMSDVIIALVPCIIWASYLFGMRVALLCGISVASCVIFEWLFCVIAKKPVKIWDLSAVVTGIILVCTLPPATPLWMPIAGAFIAIVLVKQLFGGIGKNLVNPAVFARIILDFFPQTHRFTAPFEKISAQTPALKPVFEILYQGQLPEASEFDLFIGNSVGNIGEISAALILAGGLYLMARGVISFHIPASFIATVALIAYLFPMNDLMVEFVVYQLLATGVLFGAVYLATDSCTTPITAAGKLIFGAGCGIIIMLTQYIGKVNGMYYAVIIMNLITPCIDRITTPRPFGTNKKTIKQR